MSMSREEAIEVLSRLGGTTDLDGMMRVHEAFLIARGWDEPELRAAIMARIRVLYGEPPPEVSADLAAELRAEIETHEAWMRERDKGPGPPEHVETLLAEQRRHVEACVNCSPERRPADSVVCCNPFATERRRKARIRWHGLSRRHPRITCKSVRLRILRYGPAWRGSEMMSEDAKFALGF
jgi:hypothetical protein